MWMTFGSVRLLRGRYDADVEAAFTMRAVSASRRVLARGSPT